MNNQDGFDEANLIQLKGNLVVGQSGGPTAVINSSVSGVIWQAKLVQEIGSIYGMAHGIEGFLNEDLMDLGQEEDEIILGLRSTPSAALGSCRFKMDDSDCEKIIRICQAYDIRYFLYIGGGDSMDTVDRISQAAQSHRFEMRVMGIPKTIDNDLPITDHSPGYGSAARYIAAICTEIKRDTLAMGYTEVVKILETMGRNSGWLVAASSLANDYAPDLIYFPERPLESDRILADIERVYHQKGCVLAAICEGQKSPDGSYLAMNEDFRNIDAFGHPEPGGVGDYLAKLVMTRLNLKARADKPGTIQRCAGGFVSSADENEAYLVGQEAVVRAVRGESGYMISLNRVSTEPYQCEVGVVPLGYVKNEEKMLPDAFIHPDGNHVTEAFKAYARPLIGDPLPEYVTLLARRAPKKRIS